MAQEEKELLLKDLSGRLPYWTVVRCTDSDTDYNCFLTTDILHEIQNGHEHYDYKPYLRPMSSMTEEEKTELSILIGGFPSEEDIYIAYTNIPYKNFAKVIDWLNKKMFDYRGLIPIGLALEAPDGMYNTKTTCNNCENKSYCSQSEYVKNNCYKLKQMSMTFVI